MKHDTKTKPSNVKYIQIRHLDYWYGVYETGEYRNEFVSGVEFSLTDDRDGENRFFHFDFYTLSALEELLTTNEWMEPDSPQYPDFIKKCRALQDGTTDYFISGLYYPGDQPPLFHCDMTSRSILDCKSGSATPNYAVLFLREREPLLPPVLIQWLEKLSKDLFLEDFSFEFANTPDKASVEEEYKQDGRF